MLVISVISAVRCSSLTLMYDGYTQLTVPKEVERSLGRAEVHNICVTLWRACHHGTEEAVVLLLAVSLPWLPPCPGSETGQDTSCVCISVPFV